MGQPGWDFDAYVEARAPALLRLGWLLTGDVHDAEDVVQTALARLCQHWDRVRRSDDVDAYVRRSVVIASHSRFRRRRVPTVPLAAAGAASGRGDRAGPDRRGGPRRPGRGARLAAPPAAPGAGAPLRRGPLRAGHLRRPRLLGRHCEEHRLPRPGPPPRPARRSCPAGAHKRRAGAACPSFVHGRSAQTTSRRGPRVVRARQAPSGPLGVVARRLRSCTSAAAQIRSRAETPGPRDPRRRHQAGRGQAGESQAQEVGGSSSVVPS